MDIEYEFCLIFTVAEGVKNVKNAGIELIYKGYG